VAEYRRRVLIALAALLVFGLGAGGLVATGALLNPQVPTQAQAPQPRDNVGVSTVTPSRSADQPPGARPALPSDPVVVGSTATPAGRLPTAGGARQSGAGEWATSAAQRPAADAIPSATAVPMTATEAEAQARDEGDTGPYDGTGLPPTLEPNRQGVAIIHKPVPTGFTFSPQDYPGGVMTMINQSEKECVVSFTGAGAAGATINGRPVAPGTAYTIGRGVTIRTAEPVGLYVRPGTGESVATPDGRG